MTTTTFVAVAYATLLVATSACLPPLPDLEKGDTAIDTGMEPSTDTGPIGPDDEGSARISVCNQLTNDGENMPLEVRCGEVIWIADSNSCSGCKTVPAGTYDCQADFQPTIGSAQLLEEPAELEAGDEFIWLSFLDEDSEPGVHNVFEDCDLTFDELMDEIGNR